MKKITLLLCSTLSTLLITACLPQEEKGTTTSKEGTTGSTEPIFVVQPAPTPPPGASDQQPAPAPAPSPTPSYPNGSTPTITINNGAAFTSSLAMIVNVLYDGEVSQMKITQNDNCSGGMWGQYPFTGSFSGSLTIPAAQQNNAAYVSVQFRDYDFRASPCFKKSIVHDNRAPNILFQTYPITALEEGNTTQIIYEVTDPGIGLQSVKCRLNTITQDCAGGRAIVNVPAMAPGTYTFEIIAKDKFGFESTSSVTWLVTATSKKITHNITVDEYRKWDILFVIDNSGSMEYEQTNMAQRTQNFLSVLQGLDWQIAITTTDARTGNYIGSDGRFLQLNGMAGQYVLNSTMNGPQAQVALSNTLQRPETGSSQEQGIAVTYRTIERYVAGNPTHQSFIRSGANFAVVLISDEDESANGTKNDPQSLVNLIQTTFNGQKNFLYNSIVTVPGDQPCLSTNGYTYGERYKLMSGLTGGVMGSVCEADYASQLTGIADKIRNMAKTFTLSCVPLAGKPITVTKNGVAVTNPFTVNGVQLSFETAIDPGDYEIVYHCLAD
ncbi:MAG: hypothetical protein AB7O96_11210 [Pseudobdellovibrionaceae bacterium]